MTTQAIPLIITDVGKAERQMAREKLRAIRRAEAAKVQPSGTLHLLGVPIGFPPFIAAVMHLASAKRLHKEWIRIERNGMVWENFIQDFATGKFLPRPKVLIPAKSHKPLSSEIFRQNF